MKTIYVLEWQANTGRILASDQSGVVRAYTDEKRAHDDCEFLKKEGSETKMYRVRAVMLINGAIE